MARKYVPSLERLCADSLARHAATRIENELAPFVKDTYRNEATPRVLREALFLPNDGSWPYRYACMAICKAVHHFSPFAGFVLDAHLSSILNIFPTVSRTIKAALMPEEVNLLVSLLSGSVTEINLSKMIVTDETIDALANSSVCASLEKLDVSNGLITVKSVETLVRCFPALSELNVSSCCHFELSMLEILGQSTTLTSLVMMNLPRLAKDCKSVLRLFLSPSSFTNLTSLEAEFFDGDLFDKDEFLRLLAEKPNRERLRRLDFFQPMRCAPDPDGDLSASVLELLPDIERYFIEPDRFHPGQKVPPRLRFMSFPSGFNYSKEAWEEFASVTSTLESIISYGPTLCDSPTIPNLPSLTSLKIFPKVFGFLETSSPIINEEKEPVGRKFLEAIVKNAPRLKSLALPDLSWNQDDMRFALETLTQLEDISFKATIPSTDAIPFSHPSLGTVWKINQLGACSVSSYGSFLEATKFNLTDLLPKEIDTFTDLLQGGAVTLPRLETFWLMGYSQADTVSSPEQAHSMARMCSALISKHAHSISGLILRGHPELSLIVQSHLDVTKFVRLTVLVININKNAEDNVISLFRELKWLQSLQVFVSGPPFQKPSDDWLTHPRLSNLSFSFASFGQHFRITGERLPCLSNLHLDTGTYAGIAAVDLPLLTSLFMSGITSSTGDIEISSCPNLAHAQLARLFARKVKVNCCPRLWTFTGLIEPESLDQPTTDFVEIGADVPSPVLLMKGSSMSIASPGTQI